MDVTVRAHLPSIRFSACALFTPIAHQAGNRGRGDFIVFGQNFLPTMTIKASDIKHALFVIVHSDICRKYWEFTEESRKIVRPDEFAETANGCRSDYFTSNRTRGRTSAVVRSNDTLKDFLCGL
jgi:hypothetical protein